MRVLHVLVAGPFGVGKTQFISTISDIPIVTTERKMSMPLKDSPKDYTTVAMDYGRTHINDDTIHLRGTPGQERFEFMWEILSKEVDGQLFLVDSTNPTEYDGSRHLLGMVSKEGSPPIVVVANKMDLPGAMNVDEVRQALAIPKQIPVIPCNSLDKSSVRGVLLELTAIIPA